MKEVDFVLDKSRILFLKVLFYLGFKCSIVNRYMVVWTEEEFLVELLFTEANFQREFVEMG